MYFGITGTNPSDIDKVISKITSKFSKHIKTKKLVQFIDTRLYPRDYLLDKKRELICQDKGFHQKNHKPKKITEIDGKILGILSKDTRIPFSKIAEILHVSTPTIINRTKFLEKNNIIRGYGFLLNERKLIQHHILLEFSSLPKDIENKLNGYFASNPNVMFVVKLLGEYDYSIDTEFKHISEYITFSEDIKKIFAANLKSFIPLLVTNFPKIIFIPPNFKK